MNLNLNMKMDIGTVTNLEAPSSTHTYVRTYVLTGINVASHTYINHTAYVLLQSLYLYIHTCEHIPVCE